jgi:hypothetical protein
MNSEYLKYELKEFNLELTLKPNGREGVDFSIGGNQLYLKSIDLDISQRSIKISKQDLGELKDNLFIVLVLIIDKEPKVVYLIPSKQLQDSDNSFFVNNEVSLMPSLSNWEIKISSKSIKELEKYALNNMVNKLKS